jgi:uncharacterized protein
MNTGMNTVTGASFAAEVDHIRQSIRDILTTPLGSRVMRRDYGSLLPELIDQPGNAVGVLRLRAATVAAIARWEPRVRITRIDFDHDASGAAIIDFDAVRVGGPGGSVNLSVSLA